MKTLLRILGLAWRRPRHMAAAYAALVASSGFALIVPRLLGQAVDETLQGGALSAVLMLALLILLAGVLRGVCAYGQTHLAEWAGQLVAYDLRNALFDRLQRLSFAYHDAQQTGNQMSRATADVEAIRNFVQGGLLRALTIVILVCGASGVLLTLNWRLALVGLAITPLVAYRSAVVSMGLRHLWRAILEVTGAMTTVLQENLAGVRLVRAFGAEAHEQAKFDAVIRDLEVSNVRASRVQAVNASLVQLLFGAATAGILWVGGIELVNGRLTPGELTQFIFYLGIIQGPIRMTGMILNNLSRAVSAGERVFEALDAESPVSDAPGARDMGRAQGNVRFEDVSFAYGGETTLDRVTLEAAPGEVVALVGMPGSGKSTLAHLLPRYYDVTAGRVTIDGVDIREVTLASLRRNVGVVMQDVFLFSATIAENIAYGRPDAAQADVEAAARVAQLHEFIVSLPEGYETWVGERGITLSGGQRQRLAIARTVLLDPPVLVLDDVTSSVDTDTEQAVHAALAAAMEGRTTLVIAHRLSALRRADTVVTLEDGRVVEQGRPDDLLERGGLYRQLYDLQTAAAPEGVEGRAP